MIQNLASHFIEAGYLTFVTLNKRTKPNEAMTVTCSEVCYRRVVVVLCNMRGTVQNV